MSKPKWTAEQLSAIEERGCNLLVAAAAGAGKTAVLVERIIRRITDLEDPVDIDRLLIVTFTNAAATEMRERIGDALAEALERNPSSQLLQRQMALLSKASITTIHSFCLEVIRNNFHRLDLDPNFRIANDTEATLLKQEALEEMFEDRYTDEQLCQEFLDLVECYGGNRSDDKLQQMVSELYDYVQSHPWPEKWLKEHTESFNIGENRDIRDFPWANVLIDNILIELAGFRENLAKAIDIARAGEGLEPYLATLKCDVELIEGLIEACNGSWEDIYNAFSTLEFKTLARCKKDADKARREQVKEIRDSVKKGVKKISDDIFQSNPQQLVKQLKELYPLLKCLSSLVLELGERYWQKKQEKALLDFNDLEHLCLEILLEFDSEGRPYPSAVAMEYRERFEEVMVDEYQDSNLVQEVILGAVSRRDTEKPNMFMVGDVKQSIYRFRQARPELFMEKYNTYSEDKCPEGEEGLNRKILLYKNFRSRKEVIDGVNFIFKQIMSRNVGELDYDDKEALYPGAVFENPPVGSSLAAGPIELHIIDMDDDSPDWNALNEPEEASAEEKTAEEEEPTDSIQAEARLVAQKIQQLIRPDEQGKILQVYDKNLKGYRDIKYRDIVILLRTTKNWADVFVEELAAVGIPVYADTGTGYFETIEVQTVLSLLQIIDNPFQDIPLLAVLRSPIASWSLEELIDVRMADREATMYEALLKTAQDGEGEVSEKAKAFVEKLNQWRDKSVHLSTDELIWYLYGDTGYYSCVGAMPGGLQRQANLRILFERARQYEETSYKGLFNFNQFIERLKSSQGDMGSAKILGENENVVRIMSIHKSKGLEFPVVFVSGCGKSFNMTDMSQSILVHQDLGFGPDYVDYSRRISYPTLPKQAIKYKVRLETLSEEMRILYVAMTRAREKLILTGSVKNLPKAAAKWSRCLDTASIKLPEYEVLQGRSYLDWIGSAVVRHKDGQALREAIGILSEKYIKLQLEDESMWDIKLWNKNHLIAAKAGEEEVAAALWDEDQEADDGLEAGYVEAISHRLGWEYPYIKSWKIPAKISVTELKRYMEAEIADEPIPASATYVAPLVKKPKFLEEEKGLSAAERGSILHFVLQRLDFKKAESWEDIKQQIADMVSLQLLTEEQAKAVDILRIQRFLQSDLGRRIKKADKVYRETPFTIRLDSKEIYPDLDGASYKGEFIILQGIIDCYFEEGGEIVLVDYKTDYVPPENGLDIIRQRYRTQIEYYTRALTQITGKPIKERCIYLFWNGKILEY